MKANHLFHSLDSESRTRTVLINNSVREFMSEVMSLRQESRQRYHTSSHDKHNGKWVVFPTIEEYNDVILGRKKSKAIEDYITKVAQSSNTLKKLFNYEAGDSKVFKDDFDITGFYVDVGRFLEHEPECFMNTNKPVNELIDIHVCGGIHCHVDADDYMESVERLAELVYILKAKGCNARIFYYIEGTYGGAKIKLKDFRDTLDLRMLILVQMPDFFRRYGFVLFELDPNITSGYGRVQREMFTKWRKHFSKNTLSIDLLRYDSLHITKEMLGQVARERDIKKIVKIVNGNC